ncbi:MAG: hypothetical protein M9894_06905 [Planctomycetes bacterium]|nr:hypothetical protein [Planctomycetota bacterium]
MKLAARESGAARCAICHDDARDGPLVCPGCQTVVHAECRVGQPCPTLGCAHGAALGRPRVVVLRPAPWSTLAAAARRVPRELAVAALVALLLTGGAVAAHVADPPRTTSLVRRAQSDLRWLADAAALFRIVRGHWPESIDELVDAGLLKEAPGPDPWGNAYLLVRRPVGVEFLSRGPDGALGGGDDLLCGGAARGW